MKRKEFNKRLRKNLKKVGKSEREEVVNYYNEMIDDRVESGKTEQEAIAELGSPEDLAKKTLNESNPDEVVSADNGKNNDKNGSLKPLWIVLIIIGSPLWLGFAIGAAAIALGLLVGVIGLLVGFFAAGGGMILCGVGGVIYGIIALFVNFGYGLTCMGTGLCSFALGALALFGLIKLCKYVFGIRRKKK